MLAIGHRIAGRYRLVRVLAQGGMGSVWVAEDISLGREVAIKVMVPAAFALPDLVARFHREARAAAQIRSAHVVSIFDHGIDGDQPFIVMELLDGEDLAARLRRVGRLSLEETIALASDICKALKPAHEKGVVHRDLKPANVFFARQDDGEAVKVLDFGVAKLTGADADKTQSQALLGTPYYMAPEQTHVTGTPVDHRADLWSLGVIAFRAITGHLPFSGDNPVSVMMTVATRPAPAPSTVAPDLALGPEIDRFFAIALARDPAGRFQSAEAFREAIRRLGARSSHFDVRASRPSDPRVSVEESETVPLLSPTPRPAVADSGGLPSSGMTQPLANLRSTVKLVSSSIPKPPSPQATAPNPAPEPGGDSASGSLVGNSAGPPPMVEQTPAVMSSTNARPIVETSGKSVSQKWVVWLAVLGALLTAGIVVGSIFTAKTGSEDAGASSSATATATATTGLTAPAASTGTTEAREPAAPTATVSLPPTATANPKATAAATAAPPGMPTLKPTATSTATAKPTATSTATARPTATASGSPRNTPKAETVIKETPF